MASRAEVSGGNHSGWLMRIGKKVCIDQRGKRRSEVGRDTTGPATGHQPPPTEDIKPDPNSAVKAPREDKLSLFSIAALPGSENPR
jgi:DNA-directed RNA polymerase specialized sigma24 family protein